MKQAGFTMSSRDSSSGRYERKDKASGLHEFWIGETKGVAVTIHFGKVGTPGHRGSREFKTTEAAKEFLTKRIQQKIEEGYKKV
jgi:predicted DNA-binding WGR domain protein